MYSKIIQKAMSEDGDLQRSLKIVQKNSQGKIWIVGGFIFRNLFSAMHNLPKPVFKDYDFIVEKINKKLDLEKNVNFTLNTFGSVKIINGPITIDVWELKEDYSATQLKLEPAIENFIKAASLNIQSIAYDIQDNEVLGNIGLNAILNKKISVNNLKKIEYYTGKKGITVENYIDQKIKSWGFEDFFFDRNSV